MNLNLQAIKPYKSDLINVNKSNDRNKKSPAI